MSVRGVFLLVVLSVVSVTAISAQPVFTTFRVDSVGVTGMQTSIAIDSQGFPHIGYVYVNTWDLKYARLTDSGWTSELVHTMINQDSDPALVLDSSDRPAMVCGVNDAIYVYHDGAAWQSESIGGFATWFTTMTLDNNGLPRVLYNWSVYKEYYSHVTYAIRIGAGQWVESDIGSGPWTPVGPEYELVIDDNNNRHVAYMQTNGDTLRYSHRSSTGSEYRTFTRATDCDIAIGANDAPHIVYYDYDAGALILQVKVNNTWTPFIVDDAGDAGWYCSLAVGGDGSWHIAYYDNVAEDLKYARRDGPAGAWETVVVDSDGDTGKHTSIALDAQGRPHISYYDASRTDLKYAVLEAYVPTKKASWGELKELLRDR